VHFLLLQHQHNYTICVGKVYGDWGKLCTPLCASVWIKRMEEYASVWIKRMEEYASVWIKRMEEYASVWIKRMEECGNFLSQ